ncbi:leucyl/phenylalanyl-tRNA--protein transferase [bacterium]|nr:leucyl/phenylalanyl-tRNA--protein transferase [bacterium]
MTRAFTFPPVKQANKFGLVAIGGDLNVEILLEAYRHGIFPWPILDQGPMTWFAPERRAVLFLKDFHIPKSLRKLLKKGEHVFRINYDFEAVIRCCSVSRELQRNQNSWITEEIIQAYLDLHREGHAHSIECYKNGNLVGGLYGVSIGKMFAGESLFYIDPNASKLALWFLVEQLKAKGVQWIDCQQMTSLLESFGAVELTRDEFMEILNPAVNSSAKLFL